MGGYCYLNNAALAAQALLDHGAKRIAIVDVDYHHGNGTQSIFEARNDVLFASIHADPATDFPYFLGYADECGVGAGAGYTLNLPLPRGSGWAAYAPALAHALTRVKSYSPDALIVSLGLDTAATDPIAHFRLEAQDFTRMGAALARLGMPTLLVLEGGYDVAGLSHYLIAFLQGFKGT
jgi:acetoin utilization deacetylase AcuC-like enzyme